MALCDTNGDGFIDVADVAAVASAARTVPAVPSCMPGGGSATAAALSGAHDVRSEGVEGDTLGTANDAELPPPLDRMRRASGASSSSSGGPQRWPPRPHLRYETIGDIVSFLQVWGGELRAQHVAVCAHYSLPVSSLASSPTRLCRKARGACLRTSRSGATSSTVSRRGTPPPLPGLSLTLRGLPPTRMLL